MVKKPQYYNVPLRSRAAIVKWIIDHTEQRHYDGHPHPFCFNVKCYHVDFELEHLLQLYREYEGNAKGFDDPDWQAAIKERYAEVSDNLWEYAVEDCRRNFVGGDDGQPDNDGWNMLWDGTPVNTQFSFEGRSGGWLSLNRFQSFDFTERHSDIEDILVYDMPYQTLRHLYQFIVMLVHDVSRANVKKELEHQAAFNFFANCCADIPVPSEAQLLLPL